MWFIARSFSNPILIIFNPLKQRLAVFDAKSLLLCNKKSNLTQSHYRVNAQTPVVANKKNARRLDFNERQLPWLLAKAPVSIRFGVKVRQYNS